MIFRTARPLADASNPSNSDTIPIDAGELLEDLRGMNGGYAARSSGHSGKEPYQ